MKRTTKNLHLNDGPFPFLDTDIVIVVLMDVYKTLLGNKTNKKNYIKTYLWPKRCRQQRHLLGLLLCKKEYIYIYTFICFRRNKDTATMANIVQMAPIPHDKNRGVVNGISFSDNAKMSI